MVRKQPTPDEATGNELQQAYTTALAELEALRTEQGGLNKQIEMAGRSGDVARIQALRRRGDELPDYIDAIELQVINCAQARDEAELIEAKSLTSLAAGEFEQAEARLREAEQAVNEVRWRMQNFHGRVHILSGEIGQRKKRQEVLLAKITRQHAPVVRSRIHQVA